jgi:NAD-reducing hydrogenase small subunit
MNKKKLATVWLDGCSGCHMSFLDMDERLLKLTEYIDLAYSPLVDFKQFPEDVDITLVEGAVSTCEDLKKIKEIRKKTKILISIGDCAITGNIPSMRNPFKLNDVISRGYEENSDNTVEAAFSDIPQLLTNVVPVSEIVHVNYFLPGCPPPADAFYNILKAILNGKDIDIFEYTRFGK